MRRFRHILAIIVLVVLGFFVASFFIGLKVDPAYIDIARSPYGGFTYFIITMLTVFIPSLATLPIVTTATIIWGPWFAGTIAIVGWTIGGIIEYGAAYFAIDFATRWFNGSELEKKIARVRHSVKLWQVILARVFIPSFVFGMVKTNFTHFTIASIAAYIPLAIVGVGSGELLKTQLDQIQPLLLGAALVVLIFTIDFYFIKKEEHKEKLPKKQV